MAKQEFLDNFRIARNLFFHPRVEMDSPQLDPQARETMIARAALWLTRRSVNGFDPADFSELGLDRQRALQTAVHDFLAVASQVPPQEPASPEQLGKARVAFSEMLGILQPYLPTPEDGEKVEEALKGIPFPPWVVNWDYELGSDEDGAPAVWVNLFADESTAPRHEFGRLASQMTANLRKALSAAGSKRWPYIRIRTAVEHKTA
jgi:hypothetical protein